MQQLEDNPAHPGHDRARSQADIQIFPVVSQNPKVGRKEGHIQTCGTQVYAHKYAEFVPEPQCHRRAPPYGGLNFGFFNEAPLFERLHDLIGFTSRETRLDGDLPAGKVAFPEK
ncbi:hypothetical protein TJA_19790 [Thermus sp. LT1-2-5]